MLLIEVYFVIELIPSILIKFRENKMAVSFDVEKALHSY